MATLSAILCLCAFVPVLKAHTVYKQVYPEVDPDQNCSSGSSQTCPLFFAFVTSFGGAFKSNGGLPGVQIALQEINEDPEMLPGYSLHYTLKDSNVSCMYGLYFVRTVLIV